MEKYINSQYLNLEETAEKFKQAYKEADPFPSIHFEDFFNPETLDKVLGEFPDLSAGKTIKKDTANTQEKYATRGESMFGPHTKDFVHFLNSEPFLLFLKELTSMERYLIPDPYLEGGGFHEIKKGGFLRVHADFNRLERYQIDRRLNVLVYLNKDWKEEYGGHFELWNLEMTECVKKILPKFNTLAMFSTTDFSYHGHPNPLDCPEDRSRKSLALYYYTNGRPEEEINKGLEDHSTLYMKRKGHNEDNVGIGKKIGSAFKKLVK